MQGDAHEGAMDVYVYNRTSLPTINKFDEPTS
jgi:hypothetical protein